MPPDVGLDEARARVRAMLIDRALARLCAQWALHRDVDPLDIDELADALAPLPEPVVYPEGEK